MDCITSNEGNSQQQSRQTPKFTRDNVASILKKFERQREEQRENTYKGKHLPKEISEILDRTSATDLKEYLGQYKRQIPRYNHNEWTKTQQINKGLIPELKRWKVDTYQVVSTIYKEARNNRIQARASAEIYELLESIKNGIQFVDEKTKQQFSTALSQSAKLAEILNHP